MLFITGGAGFIGSNFILNWLAHDRGPLLNIDKLTYAGNLENLRQVEKNSNYQFAQVDIGDEKIIFSLLKKYKPTALLNFAAESHVDRSIHGPGDFIKTNIVGTFHLLQATKDYWQSLDIKEKKKFRFLHVSTDEVYGSLDLDAPAFTELSPYSPNSPYSASKAASDHLVRSYHHTYGLPTLTTNCSNNYGPFQFPEKLIPLVIQNALRGKNIPIYGDGSNIRDWLYVNDHCEAINLVLEKGRLGHTYNVGGSNEKKNIDVVNNICNVLDQLKPRQDGKSYSTQKVFVIDRPGHDKRYAIDTQKIENELGWRRKENFESGLIKTIKWYLDNTKWIENINSGYYRDWIQI